MLDTVSVIHILYDFLLQCLYSRNNQKEVGNNWKNLGSGSSMICIQRTVLGPSCCHFSPQYHIPGIRIWKYMQLG